MRNLLNFFLRYSAWIVYAVYAVVSCILLFNNNPYQHHVFLTSAGAVSSAVYDMSGSVTSYVGLRDINTELQRQNARLEEEILALRQANTRLRQQILQDSLATDPTEGPFSFAIANVVNNSVIRPYNYITIDKGAADGIEPEMGVVDHSGVVGVVNVVADHHARVISLLNPKFRLSCKIRGNDAFGSLVWDGKRPTEAVLQELPKQVRFTPGDTIITSGYSAMFPEGIPVGVIIGTDRGDDDNFHTLRIRLLSDFSALSTVKIITNRDMLDIRQAEQDPE